MFLCNECGARAPRWQGRCARCGTWGALEAAPEPPRGRRGTAAGDGPGRAAAGAPPPVPLAEVAMAPVARLVTGLGEFDRVLGGGLVPGSVALVGGEPGVGKSTLLLAVAARVAGGADGGSTTGGGPAACGGVLYVTGEESPRQVAMRAGRIGATADRLALLDTTGTDEVVAAMEEHRPTLCVVDSVQTLKTGASPGAPGGPAQVRAAAERLVPAARATGCAVLLVGQVTKVGGLAGPRTLEHAVDAVVLCEGDRHTSLRVLRAIKNRYGPTDEIGLFEMREEGLLEVRNASDQLLAHRTADVAGSVVAVVVEGRRSLCVEVQALVTGPETPHPRRRAQGVDPRRVELLAAVLAAGPDPSLGPREAYAKVVGGLTVQDTGLDLAMAVALRCALSRRTVERDAVCFGEVGLHGEVRPVAQARARLKEARAMGFRRAYAPPGTPGLEGIRVVHVETVGLVPLHALRPPVEPPPRPAFGTAPATGGEGRPHPASPLGSRGPPGPGAAP